MLEKPKKLNSTLIGGILMGVITGLPIISMLNTCCCCGGVMLCGLISLYLYKKEFKDETIHLESSDALIIGVVTGLFGALFCNLIGVVSYLIFGNIDEEMVIKALEWLKTRIPQAAEQIDEKLYTLQQSIDEGLTMKKVIFNVFFNVIFFPIFAMLGALIGYGIFRTKKQISTPQ